MSDDMDLSEHRASLSALVLIVLSARTARRDNCLGDMGVKALLRALPQLKLLEALFLNTNNIEGKEGVAEGIVAAVGQMPALQTIWLDQNELADSRKSSIQNSLPTVSGLRI